MYFGTRENMQYIACPNVDIPASKRGWAVKTEYLNGGAHVRRSTASHKEYEFTFDPVTRDEMRTFLDYADRLYGDGPFYWVDPFVADVNMLPQWAASPFQILDDAPNAYATDVLVEQATTPANTLGYPTRSARFTFGDDSAPKYGPWIPIPPGHTAWVGAHGFDQSGLELVITPTTGATTYGAPQNATILPVTSTTRVVDTVAASDGYTGLVLSLDGDPGDSLALAGVMVQVLKDGRTPEPGGYLSGQGHSGCSFEGQPEYTPYSAAYMNGSLIANLVETEGWR
jgi:hypothetical protein